MATSNSNQNINRLLNDILISHAVEKKTSLVYHNDTQDEKRTRHSCSKGNLTTQMRNITIPGHSDIILQVLPVYTNFSFIHISPLVLKPARFSIFGSNESSCKDAERCDRHQPMNASPINSRYLPDIAQRKEFYTVLSTCKLLINPPYPS